jgi:hypothetical protein
VTTATRATPVIERTAEQIAAEQALADAHARVEAADEAAAAADLARDGLLERLRAGDETVFSNTLAAADAACRRSELLAVAARDAVPIAEAKVRDADLAAVVAEARDYLKSGDLKRIREAWAEARRAKDHAEQITVAHHRVITDLGRRLQAHGAPRQPPGADVTGWCGRPHPGGPEGFTIAGQGALTTWDDLLRTNL